MKALRERKPKELTIQELAVEWAFALLDDGGEFVVQPQRGFPSHLIRRASEAP